MAPTSSAINACNAHIVMADANGVIRDISGSTNMVGLSFERMIGDFKVFSQTWPYRLDCGKDAQMNLRAVYTRGTNEAFDILRDWFFTSGGARFIRVQLPDSGALADQYDGYWVLQNLSWDVDSSEPNAILVDATLLPNGEVTFAVASTS